VDFSLISIIFSLCDYRCEWEYREDECSIGRCNTRMKITSKN